MKNDTSNDAGSTRHRRWSRLTLVGVIALLGLAAPQGASSAETVSRDCQVTRVADARGDFRLDLAGTTLTPGANGLVTVDRRRKQERLLLDLEAEGIPSPRIFGNEFLTYVVWGLDGEGRTENLGRLDRTAGSDAGWEHQLGEREYLGLIVTAEPYFAVSTPSELIVLRATMGKRSTRLDWRDVRCNLVPRDGYRSNRSDQELELALGDAARGRESLVEAQNALDIAVGAGAAETAPELIDRVRSRLLESRRLFKSKRTRADAVAAAEDATEIAEVARMMAVGRRAADERGAAAEVSVAAPAAVVPAPQPAPTVDRVAMTSAEFDRSLERAIGDLRQELRAQPAPAIVPLPVHMPTYVAPPSGGMAGVEEHEREWLVNERSALAAERRELYDALLRAFEQANDAARRPLVVQAAPVVAPTPSVSSSTAPTASDATPAAPGTAPAALVAPPTAPLAAPAASVVAPAASVVAPAAPGTAPAALVATPAAPVAAPVAPLAAPVAPVAAPTASVTAPTGLAAAPAVAARQEPASVGGAEPMTPTIAAPAAPVTAGAQPAGATEVTPALAAPAPDPLIAERALIAERENELALERQRLEQERQAAEQLAAERAELRAQAEALDAERRALEAERAELQASTVPADAAPTAIDSTPELAAQEVVTETPAPAKKRGWKFWRKKPAAEPAAALAAEPTVASSDAAPVAPAATSAAAPAVAPAAAIEDAAEPEPKEPRRWRFWGKKKEVTPASTPTAAEPEVVGMEPSVAERVEFEVARAQLEADRSALAAAQATQAAQAARPVQPVALQPVAVQPSTASAPPSDARIDRAVVELAEARQLLEAERERLLAEQAATTVSIEAERAAGVTPAPSGAAPPAGETRLAEIEGVLADILVRLESPAPAPAVDTAGEAPAPAGPPAWKSRLLELGGTDIERGVLIRLDGVSFAVGSAALTPESREHLARVAGLLFGVPDMIIEVEGHTDSTGSPQANRSLSERRAEAVTNYLRESGLSSPDIRWTGHGDTRPVASNDSADGRRRNRRVDLVIRTQNS